MRDYRSFYISLFIIVSLLLSLLTVIATAEGGIGVSARSSALYEPLSGDFVYEKNMNERLSMASTTKIMTALLAIELCDPDEPVEIPEEATGIEGSSIYLKTGDRVTVRDLIYSVLLQSANDAATALAVKIGGDVRGFADMMNARAEAIGLCDTHYDNPHGLDSEEHYTTAHDLALLAAEALKNESFARVCSTYKYSFTISDSPRTVVNHNKLLKRYKGAIGVKTGYTDKSGRCLVSAAERDGLTLIAVTLDAPNDWNDHTRMLDFGFSRYMAVRLTDLTKTVYELSVAGGKDGSVKVCAESVDKIYTRKLTDPEFSAQLELKRFVFAPVKEGDEVGRIIIKQADRIIDSIPLTATENVGRKERVRKFPRLW